MTDTISALGNFDSLVSGKVNFESLPYVLTWSKNYLASGIPTWSYRSSHPFDDLYTKTIEFASGTAFLYNGNPQPIAVTPGGFNVGNTGVWTSLLTDYAGVFKNFSVFSSLGVDPATDAWFHPASPRESDTPVGDITVPWAQISAMVYPPKNARYVVPMVSVSGLPVSQSVNLDAFDIRVVPSNDDALSKPTWSSPRRLEVKVKPTRLNYSISPDFTVNNQNLNLSIAASGAHAFYGTQSGLVSVTADGNAWNAELRQVDVLPGDDLWVSWQYYADTDLSGTYRIRVDFVDQQLNVVSTVRSDSAAHDATHGSWSEVSLLAPVPDGAVYAVVYRIESQDASTSDTFWADASLIERSGLQRPFFCGDSGPVEYMWRQGDIPGRTWSYYYEDREARNYILTRLLRENVPLGMKVAEPSYGTYGIAGVSRPLIGYGSGRYGSGPYGG